jgi:hypothetical protein
MSGNDIDGRKRHLCDGVSSAPGHADAGHCGPELIGGAIDVTYAIYAPMKKKYVGISIASSYVTNSRYSSC